MRIMNADEVREERVSLLKELKDCIFIYPTDTVYGIGCNALNGALVDKVRALKGRNEMPFSVIAPSKDWIRRVCEVDERAESWLSKLPGPYTLILKLKLPEEIPLSVNRGAPTLGVRIPDHWIAKLVADLGIPVITTSANITGSNTMRNTDDIPTAWKGRVRYCFYDGELDGHPSTLVHLYENKLKIQER